MFEVGKLIHNGQLYDQINTFADDLPFYLNLAEKADKVLEFCCGTGRLTIPLAENGVAITGVDKEVSMLTEARQKAKAKNLDIELIEGDMSSLDLGQSYSLIMVPFNSLQCIYSNSDVRAVFENIKRHLTSEGVLAFDIFNPNLELIHQLQQGERYRGDYTTEDNKAVKIYESMSYDSAHQVARIVWKHEFVDQVVYEKLDMRNFFPQEMDFILECCGFKVIDKFGSFTEEGFCKDSFKQVYVCSAVP